MSGDSKCGSRTWTQDGQQLITCDQARGHDGAHVWHGEGSVDARGRPTPRPVHAWSREGLYWRGAFFARDDAPKVIAELQRQLEGLVDDEDLDRLVADAERAMVAAHDRVRQLVVVRKGCLSRAQKLPLPLDPKVLLVLTRLQEWIERAEREAEQAEAAWLTATTVAGACG